MGNPFFIPQQENWATGLSKGLSTSMDTALQLGSLAEQSKRTGIMAEDNLLKQQSNKLKAEEQIKLYGGKLESGDVIPGIENQKISVLQTNAATERAKIGPHQQPFTKVELQQSQKILNRAFGPGVGKAILTDFQDFVDLPPEQGGSSGNVYQWVSVPENLNAYRESILQDATDNLNNGKFNSPGEKRKLEETIKHMSDPETGNQILGSMVDKVFAPTVRGLELEKEKLLSKEKGQIVGEGQSFIDPSTGNVIFEGPKKSHLSQEAELAYSDLKQKLGREPTPGEIRKDMEESATRVAGAKAKATDEARAAEMDPEALRIEGIKFAQTGQMPSMGMGSAAIRMKIINASAEYLKEQGVDPSSVPAVQAEFKATAQAFKSVKTPLANFKAFEEAMIKNADYSISLSKDIYRTQIPSANIVLNAIRTNTGDPNIVKFSAAIYAAAMEYEKIRTAGTNIPSAELSIGAQQKAEQIMNKAQTHDQLKSVIEAMKVDAKNVVGARIDQLNILSSEMRKLENNFKVKKTPSTEKSNMTW